MGRRTEEDARSIHESAKKAIRALHEHNYAVVYTHLVAISNLSNLMIVNEEIDRKVDQDHV